MPGLKYHQLDGAVPNLPDLMKELSGQLKQFDITQRNDKVLVSSPIAVAYNAVAKIPNDYTLIAVAVVLIDLKKFSIKKFEDLEVSLKINIFVQDVTENVHIRSKSLVGGSSSMTKDGKPTATLQKEVNDWLKELIVDDYVIIELAFETDALAEVLATATSKINRESTKSDEKIVPYVRKLLDIGVVRMPDRDHTDILVYSLKISIEVDYSLTTYYKGEYQWRKFKPSVSVIESMTKEAKKLALQKGKQFYS